jgi:hypothetical protein
MKYMLDILEYGLPTTNHMRFLPQIPHLKFNERKNVGKHRIKGREGLYIQSFQMITKCGLSNWFSSC